MGLPNKTLSTLARCTLASADQSNWSRFCSESPGPPEAVNTNRIGYMLDQTTAHRRAPTEAAIIFDDTRCEHVGSLFDYVDRHYTHGDDTCPLAHNPVTSHFVSGPVRFPLGLRLYRRYEELTHWEEFVQKHFPDPPIPRAKKERNQLHKPVEPVLRQDPAFAQLPQQFQTQMDLAIELLTEALEQQVPFGVA